MSPRFVPSLWPVAGSAPVRGTPDLISVLLGFGVADTIVSATPVGGGHIHNTWSVTVTDQSREFGFILQELNGAVFPDLAACEENLRRIDDHWHSREKTGAIAVPRHLHAIDGAGVHMTLASGSVWRASERIEHSYAPRQIESPEQAYDAARAFGLFDAKLQTLPGPSLRPTIPRFHDLMWRVEQLRTAVVEDRVDRKRSVPSVLENAERLVAILTPPARVLMADGAHEVHNDAKITNLLFSRTTGLPVAVVDLDTTMAGSPMLDLGELIRSGASERPEDSRDLDSIHVRGEIVFALIDGFASSVGIPIIGDELTRHAGPILALENGLRFLADHLNGDRYFRADRENQNLDRARVQFRLTDELLRLR